MLESTLGVGFHCAAMTHLIFPRPFMVEPGHRGGVGLGEWVARCGANAGELSSSRHTQYGAGSRE